jgi:hypothetical protein
MSIRFPSPVHAFLRANSDAGLGSINEQVVAMAEREMRIAERRQRRVAERESVATEAPAQI